MLLCALLWLAPAQAGGAARAGAAPSWELGVGAVNSLDEGDWFRYVDGLRGVGRRISGAWAAEGQLYVAPDAGRYPATATVLLDTLDTLDTLSELDRDYGVPVTQDLGSVTLLMGWRGLAEAEPPRGGFRLYAGAELRYQALGVLLLEAGGVDGVALSEQSRRRLALGAVLGVGWQLELEQAGLRFALYDRASLAADGFPAPAGVTLLRDSERVSHAPTLALDLLRRF